MKTICASLLTIVMLSVLSCKKDDSSQPSAAKVTVSFLNRVGNEPLELGPMKYTNTAGNLFSVSMLKYYVSNLTFIKADGTEYNTGTHELIDASDAASGRFVIDSVPNGNYKSVRFLVGVEPERNHSGAQDGDLDPVHGMIWTWNTGYIFYKHEGNFRDSTGATRPLVFHLGTDRALTSVTVPVSFEVSGSAKGLPISFDLQSAYASPGKLDFNQDNNRMSTDKNDVFWIMAMQANFADAFTYVPEI